MGRSPYLGSARYLRRPVIAPKVNSCLCWAPSCTSPHPGGELVPRARLTAPARRRPGVDAPARPDLRTRRIRQDHPDDPVAGIGRARGATRRASRSGWPGSRWTRRTPTCAGSSRISSRRSGRRSPEVGGEALALMETDRGLPAEDVLVSLVNDLDALAGPTVLALDDYHVIDARDVHEAVTFLLDTCRPSVTLAITTRADPPLPLGAAARPRRAPRAARRRPALHRGRGRARSSTTSWAWTSSRRRSPPWRPAPRGGRRPAAGRPVGARPQPTRRRGRSGALRRGVHRQPPVRPGLPARGGPGPAAGRRTRVPPRHLGPRPADRRLCDAVTGAHRTARRCSRRSNGRTCSSSRWTTSAGGTATTTSSPTRCVPACLPGIPSGSASCTRPPADGSPRTG